MFFSYARKTLCVGKSFEKRFWNGAEEHLTMLSPALSLIVQSCASSGLEAQVLLCVYVCWPQILLQSQDPACDLAYRRGYTDDFFDTLYRVREGIFPQLTKCKKKLYLRNNWFYYKYFFYEKMFPYT